MRIFHGQDYYDAMQGTGYENIVLQRSSNTLVALKDYYPLFNLSIHNERYIPPVFANMYFSDGVQHIPFHILVGQTVYHGVWVGDGKENTGYVCHTEDEMIHASDTFESHHPDMLRQLNHNKYKFGAEPLKPNGIALARKHNINIAIVSAIIPKAQKGVQPIEIRNHGLAQNSVNPEKNDTVYINPPFLKNFRLQQILPPEQAYQDIQMALRDHLNPENNAIQPNDTNRMAKHGMDSTSFRGKISR